MKRRTFIQSVAAMASGLAVGHRLGFVAKPPIRYDLFCGQDWRYALAHPFAVGDNTYASDSKILITHGGHHDTRDDGGKFPNVDGLMWDEFDQPGWERLRRGKIIETETGGMCPQCMGTGRVGKVYRCTVCKEDPDGWGLLADGTIGCPHCHYGWCGGSKCDACEFTVDIDGDVECGWTTRAGELVDGDMFGGAYLNRIRTLPGDIEYRTFRGPTGGWKNSETHILAFRWGDGGKGFLMGIDP